MASPVTRDTRPSVQRHLEASDPARPPRGPNSPTGAAPPHAGRATRLLSGIVLCCLATPAAAETWSERAGVCDEWAGTWSVTEARPGVWTGTATQRNVGGSCVPADGRILTGAVEAVMSGDRFSAQKLHMPDGSDCSYTGTSMGIEYPARTCVRRLPVRSASPYVNSVSPRRDDEGGKARRTRRCRSFPGELSLPPRSGTCASGRGARTTSGARHPGDASATGRTGQGSRTGNHQLNEMRKSKTAHPRRRSKQRPFSTLVFTP